ncbi:MAG: ATP-binding protein [Polyangiaceae bacterium]
MSRADDIQELIDGGETRRTDFKAACAFVEPSRAVLAKDIIAMSNTRDGGSIVVGVAEGPGRRPIIEGLTDEQLASFDITKVGDYVNKWVAPHVKLSLERVEIAGKAIAVLSVAEFATQPLVCLRNGPIGEGNKAVFFEGDLLIRTEAAQSRRVQSADEMQALLRLAIAKTGDDLLSQMKRIIEGKHAPLGVDAANLHAEALAAWAELRPKIPGGTMEVQLLPSQAIGVRPDQFQLKAAVETSTVHRVELEFPLFHLGTVNSVNQAHGVKADVLVGGRHYETWYADASGAFFSERMIPEAFDSPTDRKVYWKRTTYTLLLVAEFVKRFQEALRHDADFMVRITLHDVKDRVLLLEHPTLREFRCGVSEIPIVDSASVVDLRDATELGGRLITKVMALFGYPVSADDLAELMTNFRENRW